ncbi:hypothetical protein Ddye_026075 [Dipteronia dyeriana]|uniref:Uncharacterized protein n=1 Tax=Dipteronia dyeriana TaxID=168575 RepID=A0AAD9WQ70_9ROSI|nr:hypothetical protein Ddye_026075 [Dipteronia dyeriana]
MELLVILRIRSTLWSTVTPNLENDENNPSRQLRAKHIKQGARSVASAANLIELCCQSNVGGCHSSSPSTLKAHYTSVFPQLNKVSWILKAAIRHPHRLSPSFVVVRYRCHSFVIPVVYRHRLVVTRPRPRPRPRPHRLSSSSQTPSPLPVVIVGHRRSSSPIVVVACHRPPSSNADLHLPALNLFTFSLAKFDLTLSTIHSGGGPRHQDTLQDSSNDHRCTQKYGRDKADRRERKEHPPQKDDRLESVEIEKIKKHGNIWSLVYRLTRGGTTNEGQEIRWRGELEGEREVLLRRIEA